MGMGMVTISQLWEMVQNANSVFKQRTLEMVIIHRPARREQVDGIRQSPVVWNLTFLHPFSLLLSSLSLSLCVLSESGHMTCLGSHIAGLNQQFFLWHMMYNLHTSTKYVYTRMCAISGQYSWVTEGVHKFVCTLSNFCTDLQLLHRFSLVVQQIRISRNHCHRYTYILKKRLAKIL